jgi:transcription initiation factor IIF auxiliary subunit
MRFLAFKKPPFRIDERGWGEFDMKIHCSFIARGGDQILDHDLNFAKERYEATHTVVRHRHLASYIL